MVTTRRAHRERMEISRWLPNEVLVHIIQHTLKTDQAALARVSKLFRDLCLPILYREVGIFEAISAIPSFCSGLIENPCRAHAVRSFTLNVPYSRYHGHPEIPGDLILATLKLMLRLAHLTVSGYAFDILLRGHVLLEEAKFPELISCNLWVPSTSPEGFWTNPSDLAVAFLGHHSTLRRIHLQSDYDMVAPQSVRVSLPNLEFFEGDAAFVLAIDAIGLKEVHLLWSYKDNAIDKIFARISSMTNPDLPFISSHVCLGDRCNEIVASVSKHMPHTRTLRLRPSFMSQLSHVLPQDTIRHITECLPRFTDLVHLAIDGGPAYNSIEDWSTVEQWREACPTLGAYCLNRFAWRKVDGRWEECDLEEFGALSGSDTTFH
ncbi:hypothetical protein C8R45DRAFT_1076841 [Mycena sanguinolenta]|nr:hypothetical protein C8R45DRAFT_1076841 [Mycena sanguinolenta]